MTVRIARPLRPPLGTVAEILLSLSILNMAAWPGPNEILRRQSLFPKLVPVIVTLSPALPSSGLTLSMLGVMPKQAGAFPAVSALWYSPWRRSAQRQVLLRDAQHAIRST